MDRKVFKMRELRGRCTVTVRQIPTDKNQSDLFTKILTGAIVEKHQSTVLGFPALLRMADGGAFKIASLAHEQGRTV